MSNNDSKEFMLSGQLKDQPVKASEVVSVVPCREELDYAHYCNGEMQWFGVNVRLLPVIAVADKSTTVGITE